MDAMEHDLLPVFNLWEFFILTKDQWVCICGFLQQRRLPSSLLWRPGYRPIYLFVRSRADFCYDQVYKMPGAMAALVPDRVHVARLERSS